MTKDNSFSSILTMADLLAKGEQPTKYLAAPYFPKGELLALYGSSGVGKSCYSMGLALAIVAKATNYVGMLLEPTWWAGLMIITEDSANQLTNRVGKHLNWKVLPGLENLEVKLDLTNGQHYLYIESRLKELKLLNKGLDFVIIDAFLDVYVGNYLDSGQIRQYLDPYKRLCDDYGVTIIFIHHSGKRAHEREAGKDNMLSGQGFEAKMRGSYEFRDDPSNPAIRLFCPGKCNFLSKADQNEVVVLEFNESSFTFTDTGARIPKSLTKSTRKEGNDGNVKKYSLFKKIQAEHPKPSLRDIAERASKELGEKISHSSVDYILKRGDDEKWNYVQ